MSHRYLAEFNVPAGLFFPESTGTVNTVSMTLTGVSPFVITALGGNPTPTTNAADFLLAAKTAIAISFVDSGSATNFTELNTATLTSGSQYVLNGNKLDISYDSYTVSGTATNIGGVNGWQTVADTVRIAITLSTLLANSAAPAPTGTSTARSTTIRYKKVVCWGLSPQAVSFAQSGSMGHRVSIVMPVDLMNKFFLWTRASGEVAPTGRFNNNPVGTTLGTNDFTSELVKAFGKPYTDLDGVATGLNFSSSALDIAGDIKRDVASVYNAASDKGLFDVNGVAITSGTANNTSWTHYGANDLVMAYLMYKCFGSSSYDPTDIIYNVDDAFNMLNSQQLANLITASLESEDALANAAVLPNGKNVNQQLPGDNKGQVDAMFRGFLAADPIRYFLDGKQIPGLFETNFGASASDPSVNGNWCLTVGDKIEVPLKLVFRAPVSVLSVQDNVQNPSSATPDSVQTTMIAGEVPTFDCTSQRASPANELPIRLQITCGTPVGAAGTGSTSAPGTSLPLSIAASSSVVFYTPANYGTQSAIPVVAAGGTAPYTYSIAAPASLSAGVTINSATGVLSFNAATATVTQWGKWVVPITVADSASGSVTKYVNVSLDDGNGSSNNSLWISAASAKIGVKATLAPYVNTTVVKHGQVLQYAHAPYGKTGASTNLLVNEVLSMDTLTFTYTPPTIGSLGASLPAAAATTTEWKITSQSGKSGSAALPTGVVFTPTALTAALVLDFDTAPTGGAVRAATGLYSFLITAKDNNGYVQTFPVTINIVAPPLTNSTSPLTAAGTGTQTSYDNGSILRYAVSSTPVDAITLTNTNAAATSLTWSVKAIFGSAASASLGTAAGLTNTLTLTPPADAGTHCLLVTCVDSQNISQTIFYTVVYA